VQRVALILTYFAVNEGHRFRETDDVWRDGFVGHVYCLGLSGAGDQSMVMTADLQVIEAEVTLG
jgi:hypothetical protein